MSTLSIILVILGGLIIGLVAFFELKKREAKQAERRWMDKDFPRESKEKTLDNDYFGTDVGEVRIIKSPKAAEEVRIIKSPKVVEETEITVLQEEDDLVQLDEPRNSGEQQELNLFTDEITHEVEEPIARKKVKKQKPAQAKSKHETVLVLTVMAQKNDNFEGADLLREFNAQNLVEGKDGFYHRPMPGLPDMYLFSIANVMEPGTFRAIEMMNLQTKGLLMFMSLPNKLTPTQAFEQFYDAADGLAVTLGGVVCDQQRNPLGDYRLDQMRDTMRHLEMKMEVELKQK